jgi:uncharacterized membrane protein
MLEISSHPAVPFVLGIVLAWLAGVRVYLTIFGVGLAGYFGWMDLPESIALAESPLVIGVCGALAIVEFVTDKLPGVDSVWDLLHTLVRIPAGAFLGGIAIPTDAGEASVTGMVLGGTVAALSHGLKSGTRALINTSPEPASNWTASVAEDGLVLAALALAVAHPLWALALLVLATVAFVVAIVLLYRLLRHVARGVRAAVT